MLLVLRESSGRVGAEATRRDRCCNAIVTATVVGAGRCGRRLCAEVVTTTSAGTGWREATGVSATHAGRGWTL